ncbi:hypothetical protein ILUMI_07446 [Ignelater luminosus]|uniref:Uncharacterized protein n=1 Tax=Ignelater luminosus TaxID=2038154 RepID=A0A8K0D6G8_IGNLU|nr:hypothetical protein ILUMI_07446 [Ignelater luminosus]
MYSILSFVGVLLTVFCCVLCSTEDVLKVNQKYEENINSREERQLQESFEQERWRVVDPSKWQNSEQWIPRNSPSPLNNENPPRQFQRRRRIRKRKRRPVIVVNSEESEEYRPRRRRIRPQTLEEINSSWAEIEDESFKRPYSRRRTTPIYIAEIVTEYEPSQTEKAFEEKTEESRKPLPARIYEKVRNPFTALQEAEEKNKLRKKPQRLELETTTLSHLKSLLKQSSGSLSLSEILQQRNLSLSDLLKGKQQAISALTERPETTTEITTEHKNFIEDSTEAFDSVKSTTRRNFDSEENISKQSANKIFINTKNYEVITEPTTERRIFVPSHSKHYTFYNYKPNILNKTIETTQTTKSIETTHTTARVGNKYFDLRSKYASLKPKLKSSLPITSAKLNKLTSRKPTSESITEAIPLPSQAFKIDLKDVFGISGVTEGNEQNETSTLETKRKEDGPIKMTINIEDLLKKVETTTSNNPTINEIQSFTEKSIGEKIKPTSAREEIMEILKDHVSRQNLSRILELRNMTVEELVAQRERGSSQLHLADIFHNQTREPEPPSEPFIGHIQSIFPPFFDRKPKAIDPKLVESRTSVDLKPSQLYSNGKEGDESGQSKEAPKYTVTSFPTYKIEMEKIIKHNQPPPFQISIWKNLYPNLYTGDYENIDSTGDLDKLKPTKVVDIFENDIRRIEDIENGVSDAVNDKLNVDLNENHYSTKDDFIHLPKGVKSAIIASLAIVGISVLVFLTVFCIFKWSQKQKKRFCYTNSFSCSRIKSPILEPEPRRTFRTIMSETLGRKKKYSNVYPQSMSDHVWECDKKPFQ